MCSISEIKTAFKENNIIRDLNLENKLAKNNEKIFTHIQDVLKHNQTAPETKRAIEGIKSECVARGTSIALTNQKMTDIEKKVDSMDKKMDQIMEKLDKKFASKWVEKGAVMLITIAVGAIVYKIFEVIGLKK